MSKGQAGPQASLEQVTKGMGHYIITTHCFSPSSYSLDTPLLEPQAQNYGEIAIQSLRPFHSQGNHEGMSPKCLYFSR